MSNLHSRERYQQAVLQAMGITVWQSNTASTDDSAATPKQPILSQQLLDDIAIALTYLNDSYEGKVQESDRVHSELVFDGQKVGFPDGESSFTADLKKQLWAKLTERG
ncbi:hypothetical protein [Alteromonas facilis]|uniref:hypothetical protein n=1 Tax=Alteromonas facilis TaxID=2048004 RepID=UPI000C28FEEA|nr:hypothetical protein [Alteromonas facilis]